jgi:hypothetical protein
MQCLVIGYWIQLGLVSWEKKPLRCLQKNIWLINKCVPPELNIYELILMYLGIANDFYKIVVCEKRFSRTCTLWRPIIQSCIVTVGQTVCSGLFQWRDVWRDVVYLSDDVTRALLSAHHPRVSVSLLRASGSLSPPQHPSPASPPYPPPVGVARKSLGLIGGGEAILSPSLGGGGTRCILWQACGAWQGARRRCPAMEPFRGCGLAATMRRSPRPTMNMGNF